jgi:Zn-dependent protease
VDRLTEDRDRDLAADRHDGTSRSAEDESRWAAYRSDPEAVVASEPEWSSYRPATDEPLRDYEPVHPKGYDWRRLGRALATPFIFVGLLLWKFKFVLVAIFKFKIFTVGASMAVSIAAYSLIWGWKFAVGIVLLLLVHELGHVLEARRQGLPTSAPMFIPFLGAFITMKEMPKNAWREAQVALAGPIVGSLGAAATWGLGEALDSEMLVAIAFVGFFLNLFNLLPVVPLDGGRAVAALHPSIWLVGLALLAILAVISQSIILLLILFIGGMELWNRWSTRHAAELESYYRVTRSQRVIVAVTYIGLAALLAVGMNATHIERDLSDV